MSRFTVFITQPALQEMKDLPGHVRQRAKRAVAGLADEPRPPESNALDVPGITCEARRIRLDSWRILYAVSDGDKFVDVVAVRKRPPYDYGDLEQLLLDAL